MVSGILTDGFNKGVGEYTQVQVIHPLTLYVGGQPNPLVKYFQYDTFPILEIQIKDYNKDPLSLLLAKVTLSIGRKEKKENKILTSGECTITDASQGKCTYSFVDNELDEVGEWTMQIRTVYPTGGKISLQTKFNVIRKL